ncbi:MAG: hypothetical protein CM15mP74_36890 [Halieaceae bacterium]|nr:MAG: hypothetical protein CM15mP74_36890 [Halieaceae bacterium]
MKVLTKPDIEQLLPISMDGGPAAPALHWRRGNDMPRAPRHRGSSERDHRRCHRKSHQRRAIGQRFDTVRPIVAQIIDDRIGLELLGNSNLCSPHQADHLCAGRLGDLHDQ